VTEVDRAAPEATLVQLARVVAGYGDQRILAEVDLSVRAGELCAVVGPNGAGKSTLVRVLAGALAPWKGAALLGGRPLGSLDRRDVAKAVAVVHQHVDVALGFRVAEVVMMGRAPHQGAWMRPGTKDIEAVERAIEACDLEAIRERSVDALSGGEQRRVAVARALAQQADVLLLDEPTAHLDVRHALDVLRVLRAEVQARKVACLVVLHDLNLAAAHADRLVVLREGRIAVEGGPREVIRRDVLEPVFDARLVVGDHPDLPVPWVLPRAGTH
jgi:iron complex transport system ATP-binding protein